MSHCRLGVCVSLLVVLLHSPGAVAGDLFGWKKPAAAAVPPAPYNPPSVVAGSPPGPYRYPPLSSGNYPWYGYGFGVPTYNWGYFGAAYHPASIAHHGYYGDYTQWGWRQGY